MSAVLATADGRAPVRPRRSGVPKRLSIVLTLAFAAICVLCVSLTLDEVNGLIRHRAMFEALQLAIVPVPFLGLLLVSLDRVRPEPRTCMLVALMWGVCVATYVSLQMNSFWAEKVGEAPGSAGTRAAVFVAPWVEEVAKGSVVFLLLLWRRHDFGGVVAGAVYGGLAGVGFAFTENLLYYASTYQSVLLSRQDVDPWDPMWDLFILRGVSSCFVHPVFTMMTGIGIGVAVRASHIGTRIIAPVVGFSLAACLHMSFNTVASYSPSQTGFRIAVFSMFLPTAVLGVLVVLWLKRRERRSLEARLLDFAVFGWLRSDHIPYITDPRQRVRARRYAKRHGKAERRRVVQFQRAGLDLAVLRDRMVRGVVGADDLERERLLIGRVRELRRQVILPSDDRDDTRSAYATSSW